MTRTKTTTTRTRRTGARKSVTTRSKAHVATVDATPLRELWLAGLGAAAATGEAANDFVDVLVRKGRETEPRVVATVERAYASARKSAVRTADEIGARAKGAVDEAFLRLGVDARPRTKNVLHRLGDLAEAIL